MLYSSRSANLLVSSQGAFFVDLSMCNIDNIESPSRMNARYYVRRSTCSATYVGT